MKKIICAISILLIVVYSKMVHAQVPEPILWGMSNRGGMNTGGYPGSGNIFRINGDGSDYMQPFTFTTTSPDGYPFL